MKKSVIGTEPAMYVFYGASLACVTLYLVQWITGELDMVGSWIVSVFTTAALLISVYMNKERVKHENQMHNQNA